MEVEITIAGVRDAREIHALYRAAFLPVARRLDNFNIPPLKDTAEEIAADFGKYVYFKYMTSGKITGSVRGHIIDGNTCYVGRLVVDPEIQNRGVGNRLMEALEKYFAGCDAYALFTSTATPESVHLYEKRGYVVTRREVEDGIPMAHMEKRNFVKYK